jgi:transposase
MGNGSGLRRFVLESRVIPVVLGRTPAVFRGCSLDRAHGSPRRDLDRKFGPWNSAYQRFRRWALKGAFEQIFDALSGDPDFEYSIIDGTIVRAHQHGTGTRGDSKSGCRALARRSDDQDRGPG